MCDTDEKTLTEHELMVWPTSLAQWRQYPPAETPETEYNLQFWSQMAAEFASQGVRLYRTKPEARLPFLRLPPLDAYDNLRLPPDVYETEPGSYLSERNMQQRSPSVYPGVLRDSDVMIRVASEGSRPSRQLQILRYLSEENARTDAPRRRNHAIPIVQELVFQDWTFVVMPRMGLAPLADDSATTGRNWFTTMSEILECISQTLEGFVFLHDQLIAHQDIAASNFVINHLGDNRHGYLSRFPCRYFIIDFELAVQFLPDTDPSERKVVGPPMENFAPSRCAPEVDTTSRRAHCPFSADVWQFGMMLFRVFPTQSEHICRFARSMLSLNPAARPSMREAYQTIRDMAKQLSDDELAAPVFHNFVVDWAEDDEVPALLETFLRGGPLGVRIPCIHSATTSTPVTRPLPVLTSYMYH